mgnify:CR=1 FL=1
MCIDRATKYQGVDGPDENGDRQDGIRLENRQECENADGELVGAGVDVDGVWVHTYFGCRYKNILTEAACVAKAQRGNNVTDDVSFTVCSMFGDPALANDWAPNSANPRCKKWNHYEQLEEFPSEADAYGKWMMREMGCDWRDAGCRTDEVICAKKDAGQLANADTVYAGLDCTRSTAELATTSFECTGNEETGRCDDRTRHPPRATLHPPPPHHAAGTLHPAPCTLHHRPSPLT